MVSRVVASGADGLFFVGFVDSGLGPLLAPMRRRLGRSVPVISPDGLLPIPDALDAIGPAAIGIYVLRIVGGTQPGPNFVRDFQGAVLDRTIQVPGPNP